MQNIISESREFNKIERYLMTKSPAITSIKDVEDNTSIPVSGYIVFEDENKDGDINTILSIITPDNKVYSAQSQTFRDSLMDIDELMNGESYSIIKISGVTKSGRPFVNCVLDVNSVSK